MKTPSMTMSDLFVRQVDSRGRTRVEHYRVWNADKKLAALQDDARKENRDVKEPDALRLARVDLIDRDTYKRERS